MKRATQIVVLLAVVALPAAPARAPRRARGALSPPKGAAEHYLTATFGNSRACRHAGTLTVAGDVIRFDLSALGPSTSVFRAILRVPAGGHTVGATIRVVPLGVGSGKALALRPPFYRSFDATEAAGTWVRRPESNKGLKVVNGGGVDFAKAILEVSYAGTAEKPIPAVTGVSAVHAAGQTFLTWREIETPVGEDAPTFEAFEKAVLGARGRRRIVYRVYRHSRPITLETLGQARLVREVPEVLSCWNLKAIGNTEHPNQGAPTKHSPLRPGYNLVRAHVMTRYRIRSGADPLPRGTGLAVFTVAEPAKRYYAVTASIDGLEAVTSLGAGASLREPVEERPSPFPAIIHQRTGGAKRGGKPGTVVDVYNAWVEPPYHNVPTVAETYIVRWPDLPKADKQHPLPLWTVCGTYGSTAATMQNPGWYGARKHVRGAFTIGLAEGSLWQGFHESLGTLRGYDQGVVHNYPQRRVCAAARWALWRRDFFIDPERVYHWSQMGAWALRHGDLFAVVMSNGHANMSISKEAQKHGRSGKWGPYPAGSPNWLRVNQWDYMNLAKWVREHPTVELPYWLCWPAYGAFPSHTIGDFGFMPWPEMLHAMAGTKRAFAATWCSNGPGVIRPLFDLVPRIRLRQSLPAFTNCSLDSSPGDGDFRDAEKQGGINVHQVWEPETIVDEPDRWEITVGLRGTCPYPNATTDLTPRRCQRFKAKPGQSFTWRVTGLADGNVVQSGSATADRWGLVTVEHLALTREMRRLTIRRR